MGLRKHAAILFAAVVGVVGALGGFSLLDMAAPAQVALAILLIATTLWVSEVIPLFVTAFVVLLLSLMWLAPVMRADGLEVDNSLFLAPFFSDVILLFLGGFVLAAGFQQARLDEFLARRLLAPTRGSVPLLIAGIMAVTALLGMWLSNTAIAAMMLAMVLPLARSLPSGDRYRKAIILAVPLAANVGGLSTPIASPPNAIAIQYIDQGQGNVSFGMWMLVGVPGLLVMLFVAWNVLMLFFRGQAVTVPQMPVKEPFVFGPSARLVASVGVLTTLGWVSGSWHGYSAGTVAILPIVTFFGLGILRIEDLRGISWDVLLMMGGGLCLGAVTAESGLAEWLVSKLPIGQGSLLAMTVMFGVLAITLGSVMSNTATANVLMPIILGVDPEFHTPLLVSTAFCCSLAMPLPISTPPNAMAFSSGEINTGDMLRAGLAVTLIGWVLAMTTGYWWSDLVGLF